jgi:hypothetical protein
MGIQCLGYNRPTLLLGDINTGTLPFRLGSFESETVKMWSSSPTELGPENDCAGEGHQQL